MACKRCEERRKMIAESIRRQGLVKGVTTVAPKIVRHMAAKRKPQK